MLLLMEKQRLRKIVDIIVNLLLHFMSILQASYSIKLLSRLSAQNGLSLIALGSTLECRKGNSSARIARMVQESLLHLLFAISPF
jgi:TRAP-type C4-dicarboxylate transport system permease small subunit